MLRIIKKFSVYLILLVSIVTVISCGGGDSGGPYEGYYWTTFPERGEYLFTLKGCGTNSGHTLEILCIPNNYDSDKEPYGEIRYDGNVIERGRNCNYSTYALLTGAKSCGLMLDYKYNCTLDIGDRNEDYNLESVKLNGKVHTLLSYEKRYTNN